MKVAVASDHAGLDLKNDLLRVIRGTGHRVIDLGARRRIPGDDYPDYALALAQAVLSKRVERGILICGSGVGASVAANKVRGIRAALAHDSYSARQGVEHDNANVLCLGSRIVGTELAADLVRIFLKARFNGAARHRRRLAKIDAIEMRSAEFGARKKVAF
jgi:ribose 5-phosphate isomerase B